QISREFLSFSIITTENLKILLQDREFRLPRWIIAFDSDAQTVQESLIQYVSTNPTTITRSLTLGVTGDHNIEARSRFDDFLGLLIEVRFTLQDWLEAQQLF